MRTISERLKYCPKTGMFYSNGAPIGNVNRGGYVRLSYGGKPVSAHRLAFVAMLGRWPEGDVDHINGVRTDNRWVNLREGATSLNTQNQRKPHSSNKSGYMGVVWKSGAWKAQITIGGVTRKIGRYRTPEEAHAAYLEYKRRHHAGCTI